MLTRRDLLAMSAAARRARRCRIRCPLSPQVSTAQAHAIRAAGGRPDRRHHQRPGLAGARSSARSRPIVDGTVDVNGVAPLLPGPLLAHRQPAAAAGIPAALPRRAADQHHRPLGEYRGVQVDDRPRRAAGRRHLCLPPCSSARTARPAPSTGWSAEVGGQPRIVDVIAEGTSLRLTQRSDYASFLQRNGNNVAALISAMRRQAG